MKKSLIIIISLSILACIAVVYSLSQSNIEDLLICSTENDSHYIPKSFCKYYLFAYRGTTEDINYLESRSGLSFVFELDKNSEKHGFINFLLSKGIDINKVSPIDGFTPLHSAVLYNDSIRAELLLNAGADKTIKSPTTDKTPLELAKYMQSEGKGDFSELIEILSE